MGPTSSFIACKILVEESTIDIDKSAGSRIEVGDSNSATIAQRRARFELSIDNVQTDIASWLADIKR